MRGADTLLLVAWLIANVGIFRGKPVADYQLIPRILITMLCVSVLGLAFYRLSLWFHTPRSASALSSSQSTTEKQSSSKVLVSIHPIYSLEGFLTLKITFSNDSDKQCIIESVHMMTLIHDALIELNKTADISLDNNYNNMFEGKSRMSLVPYPFVEPKPNLPKVLTPHELWPYETREPFDPLTWMKSHGLENIKRIPIGLSIQIIDFTGSTKMISLPFISELSISEDGKIHGNRGGYQRTEFILD
jgi:hypothetical protein